MPDSHVLIHAYNIIIRLINNKLLIKIQITKHDLLISMC